VLYVLLFNVYEEGKSKEKSDNTKLYKSSIIFALSLIPTIALGSKVDFKGLNGAGSAFFCVCRSVNNSAY